MTDVGTKRARHTISLDNHLSDFFEDYCDQRGLNKSLFIERFLNIYFSLPEKQRMQLEALAASKGKELSEEIHSIVLAALDAQDNE